MKFSSRTKRIITFIIAALLILAFVIGLLVSAVDADTLDEATAAQESLETDTIESEETVSEDVNSTSPETEDSESTLSETETFESDAPETKVSESENKESEVSEITDAREGSPETANSESATTETAASVKIISQTASLSLEYDDRFSFEDDYSGYKITSITSNSVTSYQVSEGTKTSNKDTAVLTKNGDTGVVASGIGEAVVILTKESTTGQSEDSSSEEGDGNDSGASDSIEVTVTVNPATLTLMFIAGQSNAEGCCASSYERNLSVSCEAGTVYSTYSPKSTSTGKNITGLTFSSSGTESNAADFVAGSLTGTTNIKGGTLTYPLNSLTTEGNGKTGPDSGLAYEWRKLSGDKVWVVNAAWGGSSIISWVPDATYYDRAKAIYDYAYKTYSAEISAGHYTEGKELLFWLQGESDKSMSADDYSVYFKKLYKGLLSDYSYLDGIGVIMVRASTGSYTNSEDLALTGPRAVQYMAGISSNYSKLYVVSNANEDWISNSGVKSYFSSKYGSSLSYPTKGTAALPATVSEVHPNIHYTQIAHNENGLTAAEGMYLALNNSGTSPGSVTCRDADYNEVTGISVTGDDYTLIPVANPVYYAKNISISASGASYSTSTGSLTTKSFSGSLTVKNSGGTALASLSFSAYPELVSAEPASSGVKISWNSIGGAKKYRVYRKTSGGSWSRIVDSTTGTSYTDTTAKTGTTYYYTVRGIDSSENLSGYDSGGVKLIYLKTPVLSSAAPASGGIKVSWSSVSGAKKYRVYRKVKGGSWSRIAETTSTSYTDTSSLKSNTTYIYTVRAMDSNGRVASYYNTGGVKLKYLKSPVLSSAAPTSGGIKVSWSSVSGAKKYRVYRKVKGGSWSKLAETTSTSYTDKTAKTGKTYIYTVRAINSDGVLGSYYDSSGVSLTYLKTPTLSSAIPASGGIKVSWSSVSGAKKYRVYRKVKGGNWSRIAETTSTSYTDTTAKTGTTYIYTVRSINSDGVLGSWYDSSGLTITY